MSNFDEVLRNVILNENNFVVKNNPYHRIFVVSAYGNVTNLLLENKKTQADGLYRKFLKRKGFQKEMKKITKYLLSLNEKLKPLGLDQEVADDFIVERIEQVRDLLINLDGVLSSGYVVKKNLYAAAREIIASIGESHSAFNSSNILKNLGYNSIFLDLGGFKDKKSFTIDERLAFEFKKIDVEKSLPFVTGYVKGIDGIMRRFDRGYSDITFSKVAYTFKRKFKKKIKEAIIHKEFHLSSADPKIVGPEKAFPVGYTNYDVADQLADVGMEAIHPQASKPLEKNDINIRIKNIFEPQHQGTLITKKYQGKKAKIEIITGTPKVVLIEIHDPDMVGKVGFDLEIATILSNYGISYILKSTNANSISQVIWENQVQKNFVEELKTKYHEITTEKVAMVSVIGTNISIPGILAKTTMILSQADINVKCVSQSLRQVNMQFVIEREKYEQAIQNLNDFFFIKNNHT